MKTATKIASIAALSAIALSSTQAQQRVDRRAAAQSRLMLICAGGAANKVNFTLERGKLVVEIGFKAAPKGWNNSNGSLPQGTCSWPDRPLNDQEPRQFRMELPTEGEQGFNARALFIPGQPLRTRSSRSYRLNALPARLGGLVLRINERIPNTNSNRSATHRWSEIGRIDLEYGNLFTVDVKNLGEAFEVRRFHDGPPGSDQRPNRSDHDKPGIDLMKGTVKTR